MPKKGRVFKKEKLHTIFQNRISALTSSCNYVIENLISKNVIQFDSMLFLFLPSKNFAASFKREDEKK